LCTHILLKIKRNVVAALCVGGGRWISDVCFHARLMIRPDERSVHVRPRSSCPPPVFDAPSKLIRRIDAVSLIYLPRHPPVPARQPGLVNQ